MSWLSEALKKLSNWWKKNNSIGDVIHNNEKQVEAGVRWLVDYGWDKKDDVEALGYDCAERFLDKVLKPLPDVVEAMIDAMLEPRIASFFKSAFTMKTIKTKEDAVGYIMYKLKGLK